MSWWHANFSYKKRLSRGLEKVPENQRVLQQVRDNALIELLMADEIKRHPVDDTAIRKEYDQQAAELRGVEETRLQAILVKTEAEDKEVVTKLKKGEAFDKLAREKSIDPSKQQGGLACDSCRRPQTVQSA